MIPYLLAIAGGYLLGNATKENVKFAKGGVMAGMPRFRLTEKDFVKNKKISLQGSTIELKKLENPTYYGAIITYDDGEKTSYSSPYFSDVIWELNQDKSFANGGITNEDKKYFVVGYDGEGDRELHIIKENLTYEEASALIRRQNKLNQYSWHLLLPMKKFAKGGEMTGIIETDAKDNISDYLVKTLDTDDFVVEILYENVPKTRITFSTYDDNMQELLSATNDYLFEGKGEIEYNQIKGDVPTFLLDYMDSGGKTYTFQDKVNAVAKRLIGTKVPKRLQKDYGKEYSKKEAIMAAKRIIGSQVAKYGDKNTNPKQTSLFKYGAKC